MGKPAVLAIRIVTDASKAKPGIESTSASLGKMDDAARRSGSSLSASMGNTSASLGKMGDTATTSSGRFSKGMDDSTAAAGRFEAGAQRAKAAGVVLFSALALGAKASTDAAAKLQQSTGGVETVFGDQAKSITDAAKGAANAVGLSRNSYQEFATSLGGQLKGLGIEGQHVVGTTKNLIGSAADLAATYGGTTSEAVSALGSLLRGEADPIERFNIFIKQSDVNARLAAQGLSGLEGEALKAAETQARLAMFTEQSAISQGKFAAEANTATGSSERFKAQVENAQAALGTALLPALTLGAQLLGTFATWVEQNAGLAQALAIGLGVVAVGMIAVNVAMAANPIGILIVLLGGIVAAVAYVVNGLGGLEVVLGNISRAWEGFIGWIRDGIDMLGRFLGLTGQAQSAGGGQFSMNSASTMQTQSSTAPTNEGMFSTQSTTAPTMMAAASAPTLAPGAAARRSETAGDTFITNEYNISINGPLDRRAAAEEIRKMMADLDRTNGRKLDSGGVHW